MQGYFWPAAEVPRGPRARLRPGGPAVREPDPAAARGSGTSPAARGCRSPAEPQPGGRRRRRRGAGMERTPIPVLTVQTAPYEDQRPTGGGGLRRPTGLFESQRNYLPNFVQSLLSSVDLRDRQGCTMVVGSDGRYFSRAAIEIVVQMAAANGVRRASRSLRGGLGIGAVQPRAVPAPKAAVPPGVAEGSLRAPGGGRPRLTPRPAREQENAFDPAAGIRNILVWETEVSGVCSRSSRDIAGKCC